MKILKINLKKKEKKKFEDHEKVKHFFDVEKVENLSTG